ncbi:dihydrofolate reductase [Candidatus Parcubacteria bacterium]|nr:MAG: dihydrofolate reductase [Candidatus Parcubacteria bacterium]
MDVVYYVACSLDGYIATADGGVDWLTPFQSKGNDHGFADFYASVDALVMGSHTYEFALRNPPWQAPDRPSWVFTRRALERAHPTVTLTSEEPAQVIESLYARGLKRVWLMGGGELAASFRQRALITHYMIAVVPVLLGSGIPLFASGSRQDRLRLVHARPFSSGIVQLEYEPLSVA